MNKNKGMAARRGLAVILVMLLMLPGCGKQNGEGRNADSSTTNRTMTEDSTKAGDAVKTQGDTEEGNTAETEDAADSGNAVKTQSNGIVESLRAKYADTESSAYDYAAPLYNLDPNHVFEFPNANSCYDVESDAYERRAASVKFYIDPAFAYPLQVSDIEYNYDPEKKALTIEPAKTGEGILNFLENGEKGWGNAAKYWMVQYDDLTTGEALAKPLVTVFTVAKAVSTPTLAFDVTPDGYARFSWNAVDGADSYKIYSGSISPDYGMAFSMLTLVGETKETVFTDFPEKSFSMEDMGVLRQNGGFNVSFDEANPYEYQTFYCVVAVKGDRCSNVSNAIYMENIAPRLPRDIAYENTNEGSETSSKSALMSELPSQFPIRKVDSTVSPYVIDYKGADMKVERSGYVTITAKLIGTDITATLYADAVDEGATAEEILAKLQQRQISMETKSSGTAPKDEIDYVPQVEPSTEPKDTTSDSAEQAADSTSSADSTENTGNTDSTSSTDSTEDTGNTDSTSSTDSTEDTGNADSTGSADSTENTGNADSTDDTDSTTGASDGNGISDSDIRISATSALSEYLAMQLLNHNEAIDLSAFNEASDSDYLRDALMEAYYQNPLIGSLDRYSYDYYANALLIEYCYTMPEQQEMQQKVQSEVKTVVDEIITDGMSDLDKEIAINQYLCDTAEYDEAALENAKTNNYVYTDPEFNDSFTPAGVLLNKSGVCASYAGAFKLLADAAGMNCAVVSGTLNGNMPHAWDRVRIGEEWMTIDPTNNDTEMFPNALFNLPDSALGGILVEDTDYLMDTHIAEMTSASDKEEFYHVEDNFFSTGEIQPELEDLLNAGKDFSIRTDYDTTEDTAKSLLTDAAKATGAKVDTAGMFLGVISVRFS